MQQSSVHLAVGKGIDSDEGLSAFAAMAGVAVDEVGPGRVIATVGGKSVEVEGVSVSAEIPSEVGLPFAGGAGLAGSTATITWGPDAPVTTTVDHPWLPGWAKRPGEQVEISLEGLRDTPWVVFRGTIEETSVDFASGAVQSKCVDNIARLGSPVTINPVAYRMPPVTWDTGQPMRYPGMSASWVFGEILRQCGFFPHQPQLPNAVWYQTNLGSAWPVVGAYLQEAHSTGRGDPPNGVYLAPYAREFRWAGGGLEDLWMHGRTETFPTTPSTPWAAYVNIDTFDPAGSSTVFRLTHDLDGDGFQLSILPNEIRMASVIGGVATLRATEPRTEAMTCIGITYSGGTLTMVTDGVTPLRTWTGSLGQFGTTNRMTVYNNSTGGAKVGCIQVAPTSSLATVIAPRTARFHMEMFDQAVNGGVGAVPFIDGQDALSLLADGVTKMLYAMWPDELGRMVLADRGWAEKQPVRHVVTDARLRGLPPLDVPGNAFPDPWPTSAAGLTLSTQTTASYLRDTAPFVRLAALAGGSALNRSAAFSGGRSIPVEAGSTVTISAQTRSRTLSPGAMLVQFHSQAGVALGPAILSDPSSGSRSWERLDITATVPRGAVSAEVRFGNAETVAFDDETDWRAFTTLGAGVILEGLTAALRGSEPRSRVVVRGKERAMDSRSLPRGLLATGAKESYSRGDPVEFFLTPTNADTHWLGVALGGGIVRYAGIPYAAPYSQWLNRGIGTWVGGYGVYNQDITIGGIERKSGDPYTFDHESAWVSPDEMPLTLRQVGPNTVKVEGRITNAVPAYVDIITAISPTSDGAWESRKNEPLPELRGAYFELVDTDPTETVVTGNPVDPILEHDGGWWLQSEYQRRTIADAIAASLTNPQPVIDGVECALAPVDLGDRIVIHVTSVAQVTFDCVVIGRTINPPDSMSLTVRVISATVDGITYGQDLDAYGHLTYEQGVA